MERLSGLDASFLYLETPSLHMHVAMAMTFDPATVPGGYSFARIKGLIAERVPSAPVFQRRLVEVPFQLGHPVWVDDPDFDIDYHVRLTAVPKPGGPHELADLAGDITGRPLDRSKPLWEIWIVEGLAGGHVGFIAKMHHSTVDGVSGAELLTVLFDLEPDPPAAPADDREPDYHVLSRPGEAQGFPPALVQYPAVETATTSGWPCPGTSDEAMTAGLRRATWTT